MSSHSLIIAAYHRGHHWQTNKPKPYHWSFFIFTNPTTLSGIAHQLHGMPGNFWYDGPESVDLGSTCSKVDVGSVQSTKLERFTEICREVPIDQGESSGWNCQSWTLEVVDRLRKEGFVDEWVTNEEIRQYLKELD
ncbi:hypothetical protein EDC01DRAFT_476687 [Geopyxis carbonaria]|nr:hypothetical protein EDC01DRAFT_476687 [Geopyxis carbonaria]